ncbi:aromatic-l-amino-acid decarboxylase, partial [Lasius niger]
MDILEFVKFAKATIDFVADYNETLRNRNVLPDVESGYLSKLLPEQSLQKSEKWQEVLKDVEQYIMPDQSNSSVEKAGILESILIRLLPVDNKCSLRGKTSKKPIQEDREKGLSPCYVVATLETTDTCAFDNLDEVELICKEHNIWLHIDAAYA